MRKPCSGCDRLITVGPNSRPDPLCHRCRRLARWGSTQGPPVTWQELADQAPDPGYYVYEFWGDHGCLYVGRVGNNGPGTLRKRFKGHSSSQRWWPEVRRAVVSSFGSHEEIVAEEARRIADLRPTYNRMLTSGVSWSDDVRERDEAYQASYRQRPERIETEQERVTTRDWREFNLRARHRKARWAFMRNRTPGTGQGALW